MALRMLGDGKGNAIQMTENLAMDIIAYQFSQGLGDETIFSNYLAGNYDSSGDYWKLMDDGTLVNDGSGWLRDERAKEVRVYMHDVLINSWNDTYKPILEVLQFLN